MGIRDWLFGQREKQSSEPSVSPIHLARGRGFTFDIVGEASYQKALDALCGGKCHDGHKLFTTAQLCFQDDNPHDESAIVVLIGGKVVGYIPRDKATEMRSEIMSLNPHERPVTCDAKVIGGWVREGDNEGHYGVKLNLSDPLRLQT